MSDDDNQAPTFHARYNDDKADVILVSSDDVSFRVHSYMLKAHSLVFRDMMETLPSPGKAEIINVDEGSATVGHWLDAMHGTLDLFEKDYFDGDIAAFQGLSDKYDCPSLLYAKIALAVFPSISDPDSIQSLFIGACQHRNLRLAQALIARSGKYSNSSVLSPSVIPSVVLDKLDAESVKALLRVMHQASLSKHMVPMTCRPYNRGVDWRSVAESLHW